jgi:hypothetical protein
MISDKIVKIEVFKKLKKAFINQNIEFYNKINEDLKKVFERLSIPIYAPLVILKTSGGSISVIKNNFSDIRLSSIVYLKESELDIELLTIFKNGGKGFIFEEKKSLFQNRIEFLKEYILEKEATPCVFNYFDLFLGDLMRDINLKNITLIKISSEIFIAA